jgi:hypothetical protein
MLVRLSHALRRISRGWVALLALTVFVLFTALVLPGQSAPADTATGGVGSPDTSLLYTAEDLYRFAQAYGPAGRQAYVRARYTFDVAWPLVYTFFLVTAISWMASHVFPISSRWQRANLVPVLAVLFDGLENLSTSVVMLRYPAPTPALAGLAPGMTVLKWVFVGASVGLLVLLALTGVWRALSRARRAP